MARLQIMYRNTTPWQLAKAVGVWMFGFGVALVPFLISQVARLEEPGFAAFAAGLLVVGAVTYFGSRLAIGAIDAANRPMLMGPQGHTVLRGREEFEESVRRVGRWMGLTFLVLAAAFVFVISLHSCGNATRGVCSLPRPSYNFTVGLQVVSIAVGAAFLGVGVLRVTHTRETERLGDIISEGRRQRRGNDPFAGSRREGWDFD